MKKRIVFSRKQIIIAAILIMIIICLLIVQRDLLNGQVKYAISKAEAMKLCDENEEYHIITAEYTTGLDFFVSYGTHVGSYVWLEGNAPDSELSVTFFMIPHSSNSFLIKGKEYNTECYEEDKDSGHFMLSIGEGLNVYTIDVTSWEIISPIRRNYQYSNIGKGRLFSPRNYIDSFDVEQGDYVEK